MNLCSWFTEKERRDLLRWASKMEEGQTSTGIRKAVWGGREEPGQGPLFSDHSLHPVVAELAGARLMRLLNIGTSNVELVSGEEARRRDPRKWLTKTIVGNRLRINLGMDKDEQWAVMSEKIPRAIPLFYLGEFFGIKPDVPVIPEYELDWATSRHHLSGLEKLRIYLYLGKNQIPDAREFYSDFEPPADWRPIEEVTRWDSNPMLRIHAARLFLGATTAHVSNLLVDNKANLYTIDTEYCLATTNEDLEKLFSNIVPETRAFEALRPVSELNEYEVTGMFDELPEVGWPLGSKKKTVEDYLSRLRKWKGST